MATNPLALYRAFLRVARGMPTAHRRRCVQVTARERFAASTGRSEDWAYGECMLEQALEQQRHLAKCKAEGLLDRELLPDER